MSLFTDRQAHIASYIVIIIALTALIPLHLLASFFAGFLIYEIIHSLNKMIEPYTKSSKTKLILSIVLSVTIIALLVLAITSLVNFTLSDLQGHHGLDGFNAQIDKTLINIQQEIAKFLPSYIPNNISDLKNNFMELIKNNIQAVRSAGTDFLHNIATTFIGLIIGILVSVQTNNSKATQPQPAFKVALTARITHLGDSFRNVVFAQIKISFINTVLFVIFSLVILPLFHVHLPFEKTLCLLTFVFGLIPIAGNLLSNSLIVLAGLTISLPVASVCLVYLVLIHKLEYFINAQIIGTKIKAKAWEVLLAMLIFESIFGIGGLIVAPIFYAYIKQELTVLKMI
ncbi:AI-2E family transporter [Acinetobacter boissieri]|uniref:Predicted PurR-regulated permease PerM n=1 Tax=Acinetobacter boissieri TaxID=1219383 RepID=A0A1G6H636_9GAMM|nr:AI-2E family transporter [Acinetobacter boissieri]SDB89603.1 Predicted PurR-regulated permease PerM [Acinetobacter boissieri]